MTGEPGEQCCECKFWKENEKESEWGICRRYPTPEPAKLYFHWCGEFKQKKSPPGAD
jgi:hypothetical protein